MDDRRLTTCRAWQAGGAALLLGLLAASSAQAQPAHPMLLETEASAELLEEGSRALWDFRLPAAERIFRQLAERPDGGPAARHHLATIALFKGIVSDDEAHLDAFYEHADRLEDLLDEREESLWRAQLLAEADLQRALAAAKSESYVQAAWSARSAFNGFEDVAERAPPSFAEPQLGLGLLHFTVGSLPGGWRQLLSFLGFGGTAEEGLREIERAATESRFSQVPARVLLGLIDIAIYQKPEAGLERLRALHAERPESLLFGYLYGFALLMNRRAEDSEAVLRQAVSRHDDPDFFFIDYAEFYLAEALFAQEAYADAERYYRRYLARHRGAALRAQANLHLGLALEMQGNREAARVFYSLVEEKRDFDSDAAAYRAAQKRLERPLAPRERTLLRGRGAYDAGRYARAESLLTTVRADAEASTAEQAEASYRLGRVYHATGRLDAALDAYARAAAHPGDPQAKWGPWSHFYIGEIHAARGQAQAAAQAYRRALDAEAPFDYHQSLEQAAKVGLERVENGGS